jgi:Predicted xylanase/chitin deacetylase
MSVTGYKPAFFRPPYISVSQTMYDEIDMPFICGFGCNDWMPQVTADERISMMMENMRDGAMFLLHDMPGNENTVDAIRRLIPELKKQGFNFATVSELFKMNGITPQRGILYSSVYQNK